MLKTLSSLIIGYISTIGYPAVFVLMTLESALVPIPSEVTMPFAGFLVSRGLLNFWVVVLVGTFANLTGSLAAYSLGYWGQEKFVRNLIKKYGKYVLITYDEVETAEKWFRKRGALIAFASRLLPVIRTFISLPAGFSQMRVIKFSLYTFVGALIWTTFLTYLGVILGKNWPVLEIYFRQFEVVIVGGLIVLITFYIAYKIKKIKRFSNSV